MGDRGWPGHGARSQRLSGIPISVYCDRIEHARAEDRSPPGDKAGGGGDKATREICRVYRVVSPPPIVAFVTARQSRTRFEAGGAAFSI